MGTLNFGAHFLFNCGRTKQRLPEREVNTVKHKMQIIVSKKPKNGGIAAVRHVSVRERFLRFLFGDKTKLTVIVPGDSVEELAIREVSEGGAQSETI